MKRTLRLALVSALALAACRSVPDYNNQLAPGAPALLLVEDPAEIPDFQADWENREEIRTALDRSLFWTRREHAQQFFPIAGITHERALRSLERFAALLRDSRSGAEFEEALRREFDVYKSAGWNGRGGGVLFTGYCTPILEGSPQEDAFHRYPLYGLPADLVKGPRGEIRGRESAMGLMPYPSRGAIEAGGLLEDKGLELAWLEDPIDAYIAHVNGSAFIRLPNGEMERLGYAGKNGREYSSLGKELIEEGQVAPGGMSIQRIREWAAKANPATVEDFLHRNDSYVFFQPIEGNPHGSLDVEVQARRSIATDKSLFPRGALCFVSAELPTLGGGLLPFEQFVFDQDTGGAIRTAGRADIYVGIGEDAEAVAGRVYSAGQLFYLFLKE